MRMDISNLKSLINLFLKKKKKWRKKTPNLPKYQMKKAAIAQQMTINIDNIIIMVFLRPEMKARRKRKITFKSNFHPPHYLFNI